MCRGLVLDGVGHRHEQVLRNRIGVKVGAPPAQPGVDGGLRIAASGRGKALHGGGQREAPVARADDLEHALHLALGVAAVPARQPLGAREPVARLPHAKGAGLDAGELG